MVCSLQTEDDIVEDRANGIRLLQQQTLRREQSKLLNLLEACKHVKSNAILISNEKRTLGVGAIK